MTIESFQNTLFEDPIGMRFRHARELAKLSRETVAQKLRLPVAVLDAIEREDWARLGAPIFVRSYVGSYARLLGLPESLADEVVRGKAAPQLAPIGKDSPTRGALDRGVMNLAYLAMTVVIVGSVVMLAMYFQGPRRTTEVLPLDPPAALADAAATGIPAAVGDARAGITSGLVDNSPVMASLAPTLDAAANSGREFVLQFRGASWIDAVGPDGAAMEKGMVAAGSRRSFSSAQLSRLTLGDSSAVDVSIDGVALDLAPYREANVARFAVSSVGEVTALPRD